MLKSEVIDRVQELISDKSGAMRALVGSWVTIVLNDIASRGLLTSLIREESTKLIQGQRQYALRDDTDHVIKVFVPAWGDPQGKLTKRTNEQMLDLFFRDGFDYQGRPECYDIFAGRTLRVHPIPDAANAPASPSTLQKLYVWKVKDIAELDDEDEITEIKLKHVPVLIYGAYALGAKFDSILDAEGAEGKYERGVNRLFFDDKVNLDQAKQVVYRDLS